MENLKILEKENNMLWNTFHEKDLVKHACQNSLKDLQVDCLDPYLMRWHMGFKQLEKCKRGTLASGDKVFSIHWRSNFNHKQIERLLNKPDLRYKPTNNQIESYPFLTQEKLINYCHSKHISVTAYRPLGGTTDVVNEPILKKIAEKYNKSEAQVLIRFQIQRNMAVIPKSVTPSQIKENFQFSIAGW
ncbi:1,5-anhydro-D-fructose reductase-like [Trichosurus vulpecula]|uniref:1,5-anhydro-D-fructose reductase-like n=1 Tax=Trichosurus vulpecula TaxID=9337 RepID=UPI00186B2342|nr:1,5-anhydro-D-fructose reductase-like [Trichosurus vulpecula]